jgi:hypothetical protein
MTRDGAAGPLTGVATALAGILALVDVVRKAASELVGIPAVLVQTLLVVLSIAGCIYIISARSPSTAAGARAHRFGSPARWAARLLALALIVYALPMNVRAISEYYEQLPGSFGGRLRDAATGRPVVDATVRVVLDGGADAGGSTWPSDDTGFYIVQLDRPAPRREATLKVHSERCGVQTVALTRSFEAQPQASDAGRAADRLVFEHAIACEGRP